MKDIENALKNGYPKAARTVAFGDTSKLLDLYGKRSHHSDAVGKIVVRRAVAIAACAALFLVTTTAFALTRPDRLTEIRSMISDHLGIKGASSEKIDELTAFGETWRLESDQLKENLEMSEVNSYGEVIGNDWLPIYCDLFVVKSSTHPNETIGYVYRYDVGVLDSLFLTQEEIGYLARSSDPIINSLTMHTPEGYRRNWVYVYDKEGIEILGKCTKTMEHKFYTNEELKDPEIAKLFQESEYDKYYDEFCENRTEQKKLTGKGFVTPKTEISYESVPTDGFEFSVDCCFSHTALSDEAEAVSSDPSMFEVDEVVCTGAKTDDPRSWVSGTFYKTGTVTVTITDGDDEYVFEVECYDDFGSYNFDEERIK